MTQVLAVLPAESEPPRNGMGTEANPVAAVLVLKDPTHWYKDVQLVLDLITSGAKACQTLKHAASLQFGLEGSRACLVDALCAWAAGYTDGDWCLARPVQSSQLSCFGACNDAPQQC